MQEKKIRVCPAGLYVFSQIALTFTLLSYDGKVGQECGAVPSRRAMVCVIFSNAFLLSHRQLSDFTTLSSWGFQVQLCTVLENSH